MKKKIFSILFAALLCLSLVGATFVIDTPATAHDSIEKAELIINDIYAYSTDEYAVANESHNCDVSWAMLFANWDSAQTIESFSIAADTCDINVTGTLPEPDSVVDPIYTWSFENIGPGDSCLLRIFSDDTCEIAPGYESSRWVDNEFFDNPGIQTLIVTITPKEPFNHIGPMITSGENNLVSWRLVDPERQIIFEPELTEYTFEYEIEVEPKLGPVRFLPPVSMVCAPSAESYISVNTTTVSLEAANHLGQTLSATATTSEMVAQFNAIHMPVHSVNYNLICEAGSISGHVYGPGGEAIYNVPVLAVDATTYQWTAGTVTKEDGSYTLNVPTGSYLVAAVPSFTGLGFVNQFYEQVYLMSDATPVSVTAPYDTPNINFSLELAGTISGHVYDPGGEAIYNVHVNAVDATTYQWTAGTNTKEDGSYTLSVPTGSYLVGAHPSLTGLGFVDQFYDGIYLRDNATPVSVTAPGDTNINFSLELAGTISGHVYGPGGEAIYNVHVNTVDATTYQWTAGTFTKEDGSYTLNVPTGSYLVYAMPSYSGLSYANQWYDGIYLRENATPVSVTAPDDTPNINFSLEPGGTISGLVLDSDTGDPIGGATVWAMDYDLTDSRMQFTVTSEDGSYRLGGLPLGDYLVGASAPDYILQYYNGRDFVAHRDTVTVVAGEVTGINFSLRYGGGSISGHVYEADGVTLIERAIIHMYVFDGTDWILACRGGQWLLLAERYYIQPLPPGDYKVKAFADGYTEEWYEESYSEADAALVTILGLTDTPDIDFTLEPEFTIKEMTIDFDWLPNNDKIDIKKATFHVPANATYDLQVNDVTVTVNGVVITIPAGSFVQGRGGDYIFKSPKGVEPKVDMKLNFDKGEWSFKVDKIDASAIDNIDGVDVTLSIGSIFFEEHINMWVERLSYVAEP